MIIANRKIGGHALRPYIIAEMSCNHCGSISNAMQIIKAAKWAGADAIKTQCYEPGTITLDCSSPDFIMQGGLWHGKKLYDLYKRAYTPFKWHRDLYNLARDEGITIFSSVFDRTSVDLLEDLGAPAYKIASFEIVDTPLIEYAAKTGKPLIISTGMATHEEIMDADEASDNKAAFLYCTSEYPAEVENAGLHGFYDLESYLPVNTIGISDHSPGHMVPVLATAMGATIIEKHLKLSDVDGSEDDSFSLNEYEFKTMVEEVTTAHMAMQPCRIKPNPSRQARRSLYVSKDIKEGDEFTHENVRSVRPGYGSPPKLLPKILGRKAKKAYRKGDRLIWRSF